MTDFVYSDSESLSLGEKWGVIGVREGSMVDFGDAIFLRQKKLER